MKIKKNGKVIILTESDLRRITKKVLREQGLPKVDKDTYELGKKLFNNLSKDKLDGWVDIKHPKTGYPIEIELLFVNKPNELSKGDFEVIKKFIKWVSKNHKKYYDSINK